MLQEFHKWLAKNKQWFTNADAAFEKLGEKNERCLNEISHLSYQKKELEELVQSLKKEITKLKDHTGLSEIEKISKAAKSVEETVGADQF